MGNQVGTALGSGQGRAPRIGITVPPGGTHTPAAQRYAAAIAPVGGQVVWIDPSTVVDPHDSDDVLRAVDALLLSGGKDIDPRYYGEAVAAGAHVEIDAVRDAAELPLTRAALAAEVPILGICKGMQTLNVAAGGSLYQDLSLMGITTQTHKQEGAPLTHQVHLLPRSRLRALLGGATIEVNSSHHQAIKTLAPGFVIAARTPDGVIEAIEEPTRSFVVGVQWHPERMVEHDTRQRRLFEAFVEAAQKRRES